MRISVDTGDSGLRRRLQATRSMNKELCKKVTALNNAAEQLTRQVQLKQEMLEEINKTEEVNASMVANITEQELRIEKLMKEVV